MIALALVLVYNGNLMSNPNTSRFSDSKTSLVPRIQSDPGVLAGKPFLRDTRLAVEFLQGLLATGWTKEKILDTYQYLSLEDMDAVQAH
jgi:uncharacterized protein (DUF433 family)